MKPGILIISHGSRDKTWVSMVDEAVSHLTLGEGLKVEASFLELVEGRLIQDGIDRLEDAGVTDIMVIPLFVSSGSTHVDEIEYALGAKAAPEKETDLEPFTVKAKVHYGYPVDDDPDIAVMIWDKLRGLSKHPEREAILLVGHGSRHEGFRQRWQQGISSLAERVRQISGAAAADYGLLNPDSVRSKVEYWREQGHEVLVAPLFLSEGYFTKVVIPGRLQGLEYAYSGQTLLPHPLLPHWIERQAKIMLEQLGER
ncbi:sirohydrochlorin chelatase [Paenibacillus graminis]|uniref:Cobalamin biosynthesis protein CbiX n=1 Tax=Paenibacillus graminis TaxID=189425 RepID=A0A089ND69_9BACL|nr:CbiX/SirB N-terminal domain-containing protein [Paenibacillus graminis]AIQ66889.1 cobalamin biosynthesis protein CbiX [Paenibacillus graminis]MEC0170717.1 CbiX/SirB N-terminal domain-containing protein [Paenibacillus graminis]